MAAEVLVKAGTIHSRLEHFMVGTKHASQKSQLRMLISVQPRGARLSGLLAEVIRRLSAIGRISYDFSASSVFLSSTVH